MWFEAEGIKDVDSLFEFDENQDAAAQLALEERMANIMATQAGAQGQGQGDASGGGISGTPEGQPNRAGARPPADIINPSNSGTLPAREFNSG